MQTMITLSSEIHHLLLRHHACNKVLSKKQNRLESSLKDKAPTPYIIYYIRHCIVYLLNNYEGRHTKIYLERRAVNLRCFPSTRRALPIFYGRLV